MIFNRRAYVDIKEAPLEINNALKDESKRKIIRSLRSEKKYLTVIARETNNSVAKIKYHLKELQRLGIVNSMVLTREKFFVLTELGRWCLRAIDFYYPISFWYELKSKFKKQVIKPFTSKKRNGSKTESTE